MPSSAKDRQILRELASQVAEIAALPMQQQTIAAWEALNRIAQTTSFQGRRLLDGSLDFVNTAGTIATIEDMQIDQANFGTASSIAVSVNSCSIESALSPTVWP